MRAGKEAGQAYSVAISSTFARGYLRNLWRTAQANGKPLLTVLEQASDSAQASVASGKTIQATSGNGRSVTYQVNTGDATPSDLYELTARLLDYYDAAHKHVFPGNNKHAPAHVHTAENEQHIYEQMLTYIVGVTSFQTRFTTLER